MNMVEIGKKAPAFSLYADDGSKVSLADFAGRKVVLYFYPKDETPGCTREACDFRDGIEQFKSLRAVVLGVSTDSVESHRRFKAKHGLPFPLLSDPDGKVCRRYGVLKPKTTYGKTREGIERSTFVIDEEGRIVRVFRGVRVEGHVSELVEFLTS